VCMLQDERGRILTAVCALIMTVDRLAFCSWLYV
jgi:hypothetical protein